MFPTGIYNIINIFITIIYSLSKDVKCILITDFYKLFKVHLRDSVP